MFRTLLDRWKNYRRTTDLDLWLKEAKEARVKKILLFWNRGLGDVPLGLYGLNHYIRAALPEVLLHYFVREELADGFGLLEGVLITKVPFWRRKEAVDIAGTWAGTGYQPGAGDWLLDKPDPTRWLIHQRGRLIPRLRWKDRDDDLASRFGIPAGRQCLGVHLHSETYYPSFNRNWSLEKWRALFKEVAPWLGAPILLFGLAHDDQFVGDNSVIDMRGKTSLKECLAIVKNHCRFFIAPDSGLLAFLYYLDAAFPLRLISLWGDARHGVLKQNVPSPNRWLEHCPLLAPIHKKVESIDVDRVLFSLFFNR